MVLYWRRRASVLLTLSVVASGAVEAGAQTPVRQSVFDSVVHLEDGPITEIPKTGRWEEQLDLMVRRVDIGDAELYVELEGSGMPLVLINGGPGGTHHYFHPWFGRATSYSRVIYYDQRGTGLSDYQPGPDGYSVEQAVEDLDALRKALGFDRWVLVGFSYGGFLAQYYTTAHPENVAGLVLVGAAPGMWTDLGPSRQYDFITPAEQERMGEIRAQLRELRDREGWPRQKYIQLLVYNNHLNGDWKRQNYYKPTREKLAQIALYEWIQDADFNSIMSQSMDKVDLSGAFDDNPIPTLLLEGKWDLTWGDAKPTILSRNHPNARLVQIEAAGHSIYDENPDAFFGQFEAFVRGLKPVDPASLERFRAHLRAWRTRWKSSPVYPLKAAGWGMSGSRRIAEAYRPSWLEQIDEPVYVLRIGFAFYDTEDYAEALRLFVKLEELAQTVEDPDRRAMALIWQGHMLDLMGRREEAVTRYQLVVNMENTNGVRHDQYGLTYGYSPYAAERIGAPFQRIENKLP